MTGASGADSAGVPWAGRAFEQNAWGDDDGTAPEHLVEALRRFRAREVDESDVVDALRPSRLLVPLVARLGEAGSDEHGRTVDKSQELSIVTVATPDGRTALPVFTSVATMAAWNPTARPVPTSAERVALAAAHEGTDLVILDATSATEFVIRRPAVWAVASGASWLPSYRDPVVVEAFAQLVSPEPSVRSISLVAGDPDARLAGPELVVRLELAAGLAPDELPALLGRLQVVWAGDERVATRVDSLGVVVDASPSQPS